MVIYRLAAKYDIYNELTSLVLHALLYLLKWVNVALSMGFHLWTHLLLGCCVMTWPDWTGDSVWAWWMLWTIAVTSRFSWTIDVSQTLQRPCWNCLHASGICRCSPILSSAKLCKNNITSTWYRQPFENRAEFCPIIHIIFKAFK